MRTDLQISFHEIPRSEAVERAIRQELDELETFYDRVVSCRVSIATPHRHPRGRDCQVQIDLGVPGRHILAVATAEETRHEDVYLAIRDAFRAARRQVEEYARQRRGDVKSHALT